LSLDQSRAHRLDDHGHAVADAELGVDVSNVDADRFPAEHQSRRDLSRGEFLGDELEDFELACRRPVSSGADVGFLAQLVDARPRPEVH
jgi:hypothetical protein